MASFKEHIAHSNKNLQFLEAINGNLNDNWDWQVTVCFYTALHLMNAHIVQTTASNFLSHNKVETALSPYGMSPAKLDETTFLSYSKLSQLSRRSRYLLKENYNPADDLQAASSTYSIHMKKAIYHLDTVISFMNKKYNCNISKTKIRCVDLKNQNFSNFEII